MARDLDDLTDVPGSAKRPQEGSVVFAADAGRAEGLNYHDGVLRMEAAGQQDRGHRPMKQLVSKLGRCRIVEVQRVE
jgi:hypothetical protein